jgi:hypothetical protein
MQSQELNEKDDFATGVIQSFGQTQYTIIEGFWMQNDYLAFLTLDVTVNEINLELFRFKNQEIKFVARQALFSRDRADSWNAAVDKDRKFISLFLFQNVSSNLVT